MTTMNENDYFDWLKKNQQKLEHMFCVDFSKMFHQYCLDKYVEDQMRRGESVED